MALNPQKVEEEVEVEGHWDRPEGHWVGRTNKGGGSGLSVEH